MRKTFSSIAEIEMPSPCLMKCHIGVSSAQHLALFNFTNDGWGTDEKSIVAILGHRYSYQRQQIQKAYEELFQEDLVKHLEKEISSDFEKAVYWWILELADRDAVLAYVAIKNGREREYQVIMDIATMLSPEELFALRRASLERYKHFLEEDVVAHTTGHLRQLLVGLVTSFRYVGDKINARLAHSKAEILHKAIKGKKKKKKGAMKKP